MTEIKPLPQKTWSPQAKSQLRSLTKDKLIDLWTKDNDWQLDHVSGARYCFKSYKKPKPYDYLVVHYHRNERFKAWSLLAMMLDQICWTEKSLKAEKIIK